TGGAGYIGAHACKALAAAGYNPVAFDNLCTGHADFVRWGPLIEGDIRDRGAVEKALRESGAEAVMHFAAFAEVGESVLDPHKYYDNNVTGTLSLLAAMQSTGCGRIVFSGSCSVYGEVIDIPTSEATPAAPINPYARSKWMIEQMLEDFGSAYDLRSITLRYFNACGADPDGEIGERHDPESHLIPRAILALLGRISDFTVFGNDFATPDGTPIRDYIHVTDLAAAHVAALRLLLGGHRGGIFNLGTGTGHTVRQVLDAIEREAGRPVPAIVGNRRPGDPTALVADPSLARDVLGFEPRYSDLATIVKTAWAWHSREP
ncbi:MAG: UDP-glucose 4-epimerase GalE, partial [Hyphomicrobiales bacterium]|nr:UDP-glucose 4-epimerase GalE [Hyphomicrobiales bacterium]